jgi:hypothetical protein
MRLVNDARGRPVTGHLLELYSSAGDECFRITCGELDREFRCEDFGIGMGNNLRLFQPEGACERVVNIQVMALWILDEHEGRAMVHECTQARFAGLEPLCRQPALGQIARDFGKAQ